MSSLHVLLVAVAVLGHLSSGADKEIDEYPRLNLVEERRVIDFFHLQVRRNAALGKKYKGAKLGMGGQLYALKYDPKMELEAFSFAKYQQTPKEGRGIISFEGDYPGDLVMVLDTFLRNQTAVQQMIYPFATRYGCWMRLLNKVKPYQAKFYCVYDRKPMACEKDSDCIYQPAECRKSLCYLKSK